MLSASTSPTGHHNKKGRTLKLVVGSHIHSCLCYVLHHLRFCQMDLRVEVNGWSDGILVVLLGFDTCTVGLTYTTWFFVANNSLNLWPVTLIGENIARMHAEWEIRITPIKWLRLPLPLRSSTVGWECGCHANIAEHIMETFSPSF